MNRVREERGQAFALTVISLVVMLAMTAFVLDVGSWFRAQRRLQATADAAALAGAQALPLNPSTAQTMAVAYGNQNGGGVLGSDVTISSSYSTDDTIDVDAKSKEPGFFSSIFGISLVDVGAHAKALVGVPNQAMYVAPIVVNCKHPLIQNCNGKHFPTLNQQTTLDLSKNGTPGAFDLINLDGSQGGTGQTIMAGWILNGYTSYLGLGGYFSNTGAKFNASQMQSALNARIGTTLLFPVYDKLTGTGSNASYNVIGWIGFYMTGWNAQGCCGGTLDGYFTSYVAHGILPPPGSSGPPFNGVTSIQLIG